MGRIIGLDVGDRRIGVAISTPEGQLAIPLCIVERTREPEDIDRLAQIAQDQDISLLVVGLPRSLDGAVGQQARRVEGFARRLKKQTCLPVEFWDERLTSVQAARAAPGRKRKPIDDIAAAILLQGYLDRQQSSVAE